MVREIVISNRLSYTYIRTNGDLNTETELLNRLQVAITKSSLVRAMLENPRRFLKETSRYINYYNNIHR